MISLGTAWIEPVGLVITAVATAVTAWLAIVHHRENRPSVQPVFDVSVDSMERPQRVMHVVGRVVNGGDSSVTLVGGGMFAVEWPLSRRDRFSMWRPRRNRWRTGTRNWVEKFDTPSWSEPWRLAPGGESSSLPLAETDLRQRLRVGADSFALFAEFYDSRGRRYRSRPCILRRSGDDIFNV